jgi:hypothetical protein
MPSRAFAQRAAERLLTLLAGRDPGPPSLPSLEKARDHGADAADLTALALAHAHAAGLEGRIAAALAEDREPVELDDGSAMPLDKLERLLAGKEERRPSPALRKSLARARAKGQERARAGEAAFHERIEDALDVPDPARAGEALRALEAGLADVGQAALETLAQVGRHPLADPLSLARGLDLPDHAGFSADAARLFARAGREAAGEHLLRRPMALKAPRALVGHVFTGAAGPVRVAVCESFAASRFLRQLEGIGLGLAAGLFREEDDDEPAFQLGMGFGLGMLSPVARRAVTGEARDDADRRTRVLVALTVLRARLAALAALVLLEEGGERDAMREAAARALGAPPPDELVDALLLPPWPGAARLRGRASALGRAALGAALGAHVALALRDRFDEAFLLLPPAYELLAEGRAALTSGGVSVDELLGRAFVHEAPHEALVAFAAERL